MTGWAGSIKSWFEEVRTELFPGAKGIRTPGPMWRGRRPVNEDRFAPDSPLEGRIRTFGSAPDADKHRQRATDQSSIRPSSTAAAASPHHQRLSALSDLRKTTPSQSRWPVKFP
jgi:hypothetical protein